MKLKSGEFSPIFHLIMGISFVLLSIILFISLGAVKIPFRDIILAFFDKSQNSLYNRIIFNLRLPRILGTLLIGAILAIAGNDFQMIIKNPLADPFIIGISSGASFGAVIYTALKSVYGINLPFGIEFFAFVFALIATLITFTLAKEGKKIPVVSLILSGVIVGFVFNSISTLFTVLFWQNLLHVNFWLMGSTGNIVWSDLIILSIFLVLQVLVNFIFKKHIEVVAMGDDISIFSGINPEKIKLIVLVINVLSVSVVVSKAGIIGFVGLIIPHLVRKLTGPDIYFSTIGSLIYGGIFLGYADLFSRYLFRPTELPIGVTTSIVGAPIFILIMKRGRKI
ncbi:iron complex transport system permease protein [Marinitoga hydrogenitolerans DSM 16785]|uniref:Iron complex transport system permease protein n=1 Tax=Marinitoga hydrogenitolerans (strain DSM 16785 / JCM 12826 / AT1271) TaxID=1122195 RepID=A0A1M4UQQ5_MARH1|nr:iron complex transport system permease protein [Marinitoga hydrogenitolerans DSM 16785]